MEWSNLKEEKCPRCGVKLLESGLLDTHRICSGSHCLFRISIEKFDKIINDVQTRTIRQYHPNYNPEPNLQELNNL